MFGWDDANVTKLLSSRLPARWDTIYILLNDIFAWIEAAIDAKHLDSSMRCVTPAGVNKEELVGLKEILRRVLRAYVAVSVALNRSKHSNQIINGGFIVECIMIYRCVMFCNRAYYSPFTVCQHSRTKVRSMRCLCVVCGSTMIKARNIPTVSLA